MKEKCLLYSYLIISCKKNEGLLKFFLNCLINNMDNEIPIYVSIDGKISDYVLSKQISYIIDESGIPFGKRIVNALNFVESKYIIVMCDDFIVEEKIDSDAINVVMSELVGNPQISSVALAKVSGKNRKETLCDDMYIRRAKFGIFKTTLQCSIWQKMAFSKLIVNAKTPWEFEVFSNFKTYTCKNEFYALINDTFQPIKYNRGRLIIRGKIVIPEKERLEKVLRIKINLDGFETTDSFKQPSNIFISERISRRCVMILYKMYYAVISMFIRNDINVNE